MIVSLNWLKKYVDIDMSIDDLAKEIGSKLVEVEEVVDLGKKYEGVIVASVKSVEKVEKSDHLHLVKIDDGGVNKQVERDENGYVQVVCGAPNVRENTQIAWIMPGAIVPETYNSDDQFVLDSRKLMGIMSNGMIASAKELGLYDEHEGILILDKEVKAGTKFADVYELNDYLFDIENKSLTQRPDCFGVIGFAREVAAILGKKFNSQQWLLEKDFFAGNNGEVKVKIENPEVSEHYVVAVVEKPTIDKLDLLSKSYLGRVGVNPVSPIVDIANAAMMATAQPLHTFDYDKVKSICDEQGLNNVEITVRYAREGEELETLDGKKLKLSNKDIVISAGKTAICLAGVMGGKNTEIDENTKKVIVESATFNLYKLRSTQMRHGIFSEAVTRFTKGIPAGFALPVLAKVLDNMVGEENRRKIEISEAGSVAATKEIVIEVSEINNLLGTNFPIERITEILENAEFKVRQIENTLAVEVPYWRNDVNDKVELIEEVGRISGYDNIEQKLPLRQASAILSDELYLLKKQVADVLSSAGANEVLNYTFVSERLLENAGLEVKNSYKIINSISPELQRYRQTILPSLINLVHVNIKNGFDEFTIYELNKVHLKNDGMNDENVPHERNSLGVLYAKNNGKITAFYEIKKYVEFLAKKLQISLDYEKISDLAPANVVFEPKRSAVIKLDNQIIGYIGEFKSSVVKNFKLPKQCAGFEIDMDKLFEIKQKLQPATILERESKFPSVERDVCFEIEREVTYGELLSLVKNVDDIEQQISVTPIDIFAKENSDKKRITFRFIITDFDKTLSSEEANQIIEKIIQKVKSKIDTTII